MSSLVAARGRLAGAVGRVATAAGSNPSSNGLAARRLLHVLGGAPASRRCVPFIHVLGGGGDSIEGERARSRWMDGML